MSNINLIQATSQYYRVDQFTRPEQYRRAKSVSNKADLDNSAVQVTISDEARKLSLAMQESEVKRDLSELNPNELFIKENK